MKGEEESEMAIGVIIFAWGVLVIFGFISARLLVVNANIEMARGEMEVVDIAHLVVNCLSDEGIIKSSSMTQERLESCGLGPVFVLIRNIESGEEIWKYREPVGDHSYSLQTPVRLDDGRIVGGDVYVKI